jgi:hypothetical protein
MPPSAKFGFEEKKEAQGRNPPLGLFLNDLRQKLPEDRKSRAEKPQGQSLKN